MKDKKLYKIIASIFVYLPDFKIESKDKKMCIMKRHYEYKDVYKNKLITGTIHLFDVYNEKDEWLQLGMLLSEKEQKKIDKRK